MEARGNVLRFYIWTRFSTHLGYEVCFGPVDLGKGRISARAREAVLGAYSRAHFSTRLGYEACYGPAVLGTKDIIGRGQARAFRGAISGHTIPHSWVIRFASVSSF